MPPAAIRAAHQGATSERSRSHPLILAIQDTTELNFTAHPAIEQPGPLAGRRQQGILVHSTLAVSPDGVPLGLLAQETWTRAPEQVGSRHDRRTKPTSEQESSRWLRAQEATLAALPEELGVLTIADREADSYDLFAAPRRREAQLLVRATHTRRIADTDEGEAAYGWSRLAAAQGAGGLTVHLGRTSTRPEREALLTIRYEAVELQPPRHHRQRSRCVPIPLTAILASEEHPPPGSRPSAGGCCPVGRWRPWPLRRAWWKPPRFAGWWSAITPSSRVAAGWRSCSWRRWSGRLPPPASWLGVCCG